MPTARFETILELHRAGRLEAAEAGYRDCLRDGETKAGMPLAVLLLQQARFTEAAEVLEPLADAAPDNADLAVNLSVALRRSGRREEALPVAQRACALAPERIQSWNAMGLAALELDRHDDALTAFDAGLRLAPGHRALNLHRAQCLRRLSRSEEALPLFAQVVREAPDLLAGWRGLAAAQADLGQMDAALRSRERALQLDPRDRDVVLEHAAALLQVGNAADAVQRFSAWLQIDADDAQAWVWLGRAHLKQGDLQAARAAFENARTHAPSDPVIAHFHAAITGVLPDAVESEYIRCLFDDFADRFEHTLVDRLAYATPVRLARFLQQHGADGANSVLDLGCGTGLMARELARSGRDIDGVDLSPRMLAHARAKGLYRELHAAELVQFLRAASAHWELIVAADVFVYVAELQPVFAAVFQSLPPGGCFAFTVECSAEGGTELLPATGRYRHAPERTSAELTEAGFGGIVREAVVLRFESGQPVAGEMLLARRPLSQTSS